LDKGLDKGSCAAWRAPAAEEFAVPSTRTIRPTAHLTVLAPPGQAGADRLSSRPDGVTAAAHWRSASLPSRLNREWALLCDSAAGRLAVRGWAVAGEGRDELSALVDVDGLQAVVHLLHSTDAEAGGHDAVLIALLEWAQEGDRLAGRVVLQTMLPAAVRLAHAITSRPDVLGDRDEACAVVLATLWQVIATYPVARRRDRVAANLYLDTLAVVRRGSTSSTHRAALAFPEQSYADIRLAAEPAGLDAGPDDLAGPADAQLYTVLAWAVRSGVLRLDEARLLARVYGFDAGHAETGPAVAARYGVSWPALRQRCHRLARRVGRAAVAAGIDSQVPHGAVLLAA
jgi:hypothetical protein